MLVLEAFIVGVFAATDVFLFYVFFEAMLIPVYFLIGLFGGAAPAVRRREVPAVLPRGRAGHARGRHRGLRRRPRRRRRLPRSATSPATSTRRPTALRWMFVGFFIAFAVKAPMWPVHTWLPGCRDRGTPRDRGAARRHPRQGRHLRDDPVLPPAVPGGREVGDPGRHHAGRHLDHLRRPARHRADRHDAAHRVHLDQPLRPHRAGHLRADHRRRRRVDALHGQPRLLDRRAVPARRLPRRPPRLQADPRLRRLAAGHPGARRHLPRRRALQPRAARACRRSCRSSSCCRAPSCATRPPPSSRPSAPCWPRCTSC